MGRAGKGPGQIFNQMSHSLKFFKGLYRGLQRTTIGVIKGDTRSFDYGT